MVVRLGAVVEMTKTKYEVGDLVLFDMWTAASDTRKEWLETHSNDREIKGVYGRAIISFLWDWNIPKSTYQDRYILGKVKKVWSNGEYVVTFQDEAFGASPHKDNDVNGINEEWLRKAVGQKSFSWTCPACHHRHHS